MSGVRRSELLFIVSRAQPELYQYLVRNFGDIAEVILDRRLGERGGGNRGDTLDRGRTARRRQRVDDELRATGWVIVRKSPRG